MEKIEEIFEKFVKQMGHKVTKPRQEVWRASSEGWQHHAMTHMLYWALRDHKKMTHKEAAGETPADDQALWNRLKIELIALSLTDPVIDPEKDLIPSSFDGNLELYYSSRQMLEEIYGEAIQPIHFVTYKDTSIVTYYYRECRRGWYFELLMEEDKGGSWRTSNGVLPVFLPILEPDETLWVNVTKKATKADWYILDELFAITCVYPGAKILLAGPDEMGPRVSSQAMKKYGFYVPDETMLPVLLFSYERFKLMFGMYLNHENGFAAESFVKDDNLNQFMVFQSFEEASYFWSRKIFYYCKEFS